MILKWIRGFRIWRYLEIIWEKIEPSLNAWLQDTYGGEIGCIAFIIDCFVFIFAILFSLTLCEHLAERKGKSNDTKE